MDLYIQEKLIGYHMENLASEAEARRLLNEAFGVYGEPPTIYDYALARLGRWLVDRGKRLEERHGQCAVSLRMASSQTASAPQSLMLISHNHEMAIGKGSWGL